MTYKKRKGLRNASLFAFDLSTLQHLKIYYIGEFADLCSVELDFEIGFFARIFTFKECDKLICKNFFSDKNILALRIKY